MPSRSRSSGGGMGMPSVMDTLAEIVQLLSQAKLLPDAQAHMQLINALESGVLQIINAMRTKTAQQAAQGPPQQPGMGGPGGPGGPPGMGGMGMGGPSGPPGGDMGQGSPAQIAPGGGAGMAGFGTPNPDELRRTLAGPAAVGGMS